MSDTTTAVAETSPAPVQTVEIPRSGTTEYAEWRLNGTIEPKVESATTETQVDSGEATAPKVQEKPSRKPDAEARIKELAAENKRFKAELEEARRPKSVQEAAPQGKVDTSTRPKPTPEGKGPDGKPYAAYEDYIEDLSDWKVEQRIATMEKQNAVKQQQEALKANLDEARSRYDNMDEVMFPALRTITDAKVNPVVMTMLDDSEYLPDVLYTIGSDEKTLSDFVKMAKDNPGKAIRYLAITENLIHEELSGQKTRETPPKGADGKFVKAEPVTPVKRGPESSPEPPIEIDRRGAGAMDEGARALSAMERGDPNAFTAYRAAKNAEEMRRRRGA